MALAILAGCTDRGPDGIDSKAPLLSVPPMLETRSVHLQVNGTTDPGTLVSVLGGSGSPVVAPDGSWTYSFEPAAGRTNLTFLADNGRGTATAVTQVVRFVSATFQAKYTMATPPHSPSTDIVWYDPSEHASNAMYVANGTEHPPGMTVHDLMVTWTRQTGRSVEYRGPGSFGFSVERINDVGAPLSNGTPPYWCYGINGSSNVLGITSQTVAPDDDVVWEFAGCT